MGHHLGGPPPERDVTPPILEVTGLTKRFAGVTALCGLVMILCARFLRGEKA